MLIEQSEEEKKKQLEAQNSPIGGQTIGSGGGAEIQPSTLGTTSNPSRLSSVTQQTPQNFGTIQDYFKGSKQQGEKFGEQFTGKLAETQQQQRGEIGQAAIGASEDIQTGTLGFNEDLVSRAVADPTKVAGDEDQFKNFLNQWNAQYKGPGSFEGSTQYGQAATAAQAAQDTATQLRSTGGRQQLIQDRFNVYGQGKKGLDEALLQQSSYFPKVQEQAKGFDTLQDYLKGRSQSIGAEAQKARETTAATKAQTQGAFQNRLADFQGNLNLRTDEARAQAEADLKRYQTNLASGDPTKVGEDLAEAGVEGAASKNITDYLSALDKNYGINPNVPSSYIGNPNIDVNPSTVATRKDYETTQALQKLTGRDYSGILNPADIEKAGTADLSKRGFESGGLQKYLKTKLDIQDKSLLGTKPTLDWQSINDGKTTSKQAVKSVNDVIDAGKRQKIDPKDNTALQSLESNAMQGVQAIIQGGQSIQSRPQMRVYADAAVAARVAKGESRKEAETYMNNWVASLHGISNPTNARMVAIYKNPS